MRRRMATRFWSMIRPDRWLPASASIRRATSIRRTRLVPIVPFGTTGAVLVVSANCRPRRWRTSSRSPSKSRANCCTDRPASARPAISMVSCSIASSVSMRRHVPYRVGSQGVTDLISGRLSFWIIPLPPCWPYIQNGDLRALAVAGEHRLRDLPEVPTVKESGFGDYDVSTMYALFAPKGTAPDIVATPSARPTKCSTSMMSGNDSPGLASNR